MFESISVFEFLIYAVAVGFAASIIYSNIQRSALSKFIHALIDNECRASSEALSLSGLGISGLDAAICRSAVKNQFGMKKAVCVLRSESTAPDKLEAMLDKTYEDRFFLKSDVDTDELIKKYSYKKMSNKLVALFIAALIIIVIISTFAADRLISFVTAPKLEETQENESEISQTQENQQSDENIGNETDNSHDIPENSDTSPRIPV